METTQKSLGKKIIFIYLMSFIGLQVLAALAPLVVPSMLDEEAVFYQVLSVLNLLWYGGMLVALVYVSKTYLFKNQWTYFTQNPSRSLAQISLGFLAVITVSAILNGILWALGFEVAPENQAQLEALLQGGPIAIFSLIIFAGFLAPIVEELVFRKGLWDLIEKWGGYVGAIIINAFIFGLIHIIADLGTGTMALINLLPYFSMGIVISLAYYFSGKIIYIPIFIHLIYNCFALISLLLLA